MKKISTINAPRADGILSQAIEANGFIFVAGQIYQTPDGKIIDGTVSEKLEQIMSNISEILSAADSSLENVVKATIYVTDMAQMSELNNAYPGYFKSTLPAREAVCVKELPLGATIEISVVAEL